MCRFCDADFENDINLSLYLDSIMILMDKHHDAWCTTACTVKTSSSQRARHRAFAMIHGFDGSSKIRVSINELLGRIVPLCMYNDFKRISDCVAKLSRTLKRLLINVSILTQSYERRQSTELLWNPTHQSPADAFSKGNLSPALQNIMASKKTKPSPDSSIGRDIPSWTKNFPQKENLEMSKWFNQVRKSHRCQFELLEVCIYNEIQCCTLLCFTSSCICSDLPRLCPKSSVYSLVRCTLGIVVFTSK